MSDEHQENDESRLNAARQRAEVVIAELDAFDFNAGNIADTFRLCRELNEVAFILSAAYPCTRIVCVTLLGIQASQRT